MSSRDFKSMTGDRGGRAARAGLRPGRAFISFSPWAFILWWALFAWTGFLCGQRYGRPWLVLLGLALGLVVAYFLGVMAHYGPLIGLAAIPLLLVMSFVPPGYRAQTGLAICLVVLGGFAAMIGKQGWDFFRNLRSRRAAGAEGANGTPYPSQGSQDGNGVQKPREEDLDGPGQ